MNTKVYLYHHTSDITLKNPLSFLEEVRPLLVLITWFLVSALICKIAFFELYLKEK